MLLKQIQYFITVVECKSFTEAAEKCFISQSAISQQIKALESEIGVELFIREKRQFSLSEAGEYFYRNSKAILKELENIKVETKRLGEDNERILRIGYPKNFSLFELQQAITKFYDLYPEVSISIESGTHEELFESLLNKSIDLKISEQRRAFNNDYYNYELKYSESYVEISTKNPLSKKEILKIEDLRNMSCILVVSRGKEESEKNFYEKDLGISNKFIYAYSLEEARLMVAGNRGFLPIDLIGHINDSMAGTKRIPLYRDDKPIQRNYFACWNKNNTNYYIEEFTKLLKELFK